MKNLKHIGIFKLSTCLLIISYLYTTNNSILAQTLRILDHDTHKAIAKVEVWQDDNSLLTNEHGVVNINTLNLSKPLHIRHQDYKECIISRDELQSSNFCINLVANIRSKNPSSIMLNEQENLSESAKTLKKQKKTSKNKKHKKNTKLSKVNHLLIAPDTMYQKQHLHEVVISASKWEQKRSEVPNKISSLSDREIAFINPQTTADLLGANNEVFIQKSQMGGGSPMIRGFATNRVLIVVDGVRMNNAIFRSGNLQNVISLDANTIQNSEVIFGPGSVIYGSDAIGGVMDFHTYTPLFSNTDRTQFSGSVMGRWSSANMEKTEHFHLNIRGNRLSSISSVSFSHYGDLKMGKKGGFDEYTRPEFVDIVNNHDSIFQNDDVNMQRFTAYNQLNLMQKIAFKASDALHFDYGFHYSRLSDVPRYDRLIQYSKGKLKYAEWYYGPQKWMLHNLKASLWSETALFDKAKLSLAYQDYEESRHDRKLNKDQIRERTEQLAIYTANLDFNKHISAKSELFYGAEGNYNYVHSFGFERDIHNNKQQNIASRYPDGSTYAATAIYANYKFKPSNQWTLLAGARYNYFHMKSDFDTTYYQFPFQNINLTNSAVNASIGGVYSPHHSWEFHFNAASGFRTPNVDDISKVFDSEPGNVVVPNPHLKPEYAYNTEISIIKTIEKVARVSCTGFYTLLKDAMIRRNFSFNGQDSIIYDGEMSQVQALVNTDEATVYGIQASVKSQLYKHLHIHANINYTKGYDKEDKPMRHVPPVFGSVHLIYESRLKIDLFANYNGEISYKNLAPSERTKTHIFATDANGNPYCPSWYTLNIRANYPITKEWHITAALYNITDVRYRPYSSGIVAPGRHVMISLKANF